MAIKPSPLSTFASKPALVEKQPVSVASPALAGAAAPADVAAKTKQMMFRVTPAQNLKIKEYCLHSGTTVQDATIEAFNLLLKSKGMPPI